MISHNDRNFDDLADAFEQRIYGSVKGQLREILLWEQMQAHLPLEQGPLRILDAAGGLGHMTDRLAALGHQITFNDLSATMLKKAQQRLQKHHSIVYIHGPIQQLAQPPKHYDIIVCHALLEWLAEPQKTLEQLLGHLKPGGLISLAFYNRHALVFKNAWVGNTHILTAESKKKPRRKGLSPINAQFPEDVHTWLKRWRYKLLGEYGIRCLVDGMPKETLNSTCLTDLLAIERRFNHRLPYTQTGRYCHLLLQKPQQPATGS